MVVKGSNSDCQNVRYEVEGKEKKKKKSQNPYRPNFEFRLEFTEMPRNARNTPEWHGILSEVEQGPERYGIHNIALCFFYMISTTNVVCMKSKLREVVVSTKLTLLKVLAQWFINIGSRIKGTSAP